MNSRQGPSIYVKICAVHFSCKLTSTIFRYFETQGEEFAPLVATLDLPHELLHDPSHWIPVKDFERLLHEVQNYNWRVADHDILDRIASSAVEYRSWGVLDSVLRMMSSPSEVFVQPDRLLSYFVGPPPPIDHVVRAENSIQFTLPIQFEQFPLSCNFLRRSLELIPVFMGQPPAECRWKGMHFEFDWQPKQNSIFAEADIERKFSPELMRDVLHNLSQTALNQTVPLTEQPSPATINPELPHDIEVSPLKGNGSNAAWSSPEARMQASIEERLFAADHSLKSIGEIRQHVTRLSDYMIRAQQLITLIVGSKRLAPEVQEAMRKVNWDHVQEQFPRTVEECYQIFRRTKEKKYVEHQHVNSPGDPR